MAKAFRRAIVLDEPAGGVRLRRLKTSVGVVRIVQSRPSTKENIVCCSPSVWDWAAYLSVLAHR